MTVADLSQIWAEADIYQPDLPFIKIGQPIKAYSSLLEDKRVLWKNKLYIPLP